MAVKELPLDIYVHILNRLPVSAETDDGPRTLAACLLANSVLHNAASLPALWEPHYRVRYTISIPANELARTQACGGDWKSLYVQRARLDRQAIKALDDIVLERNARWEKVRVVASTLSYDVWNALTMQTRCAVPKPFHDGHGNSDGHIPHHAIPRRFWARSLLGVIARNHAVRTWHAIRDQEGSDADTLETAIACLSSYFLHPPMEISLQLTLLYESCLSYLVEKDLSTDPIQFNRSESALGRISSSICDFLWEYGFRPTEQSTFHNLNTRFPHWFLTTHKETIPISLVYIFVCLARRLGIKAAPINFPTRVLAVVSSPEPTVSDIFVDVFGSRSAAILSLQEDIPRLLLNVGVFPQSIMHLVQPANTRSMIIRASRNILSSISSPQSVERISEGDFSLAMYVGCSVNLIFTNDRRYLWEILKQVTRLPLDALSVMADALAPCLNLSLREQLLANCKAFHEDENRAATRVMLRSKIATPIRYFVGMIFRHARYEYVGYIYGWEPSCVASESEWMVTMEMDRLSRAQHQPFYHVLTQSGTVKYEAEENIVPTTLGRWELRQLFERAPEAGRYFEGLVKENGRTRLLPSPELLSAYPEDDAVGERWIRDGISH